MRKSVLSSIFLISLLNNATAEEPVSIEELKRVVVYLIKDVRELKRENEELKIKISTLEKENAYLKTLIRKDRGNSIPPIPKLFTDRKLKPIVLYTGTFKSFRNALIKSNELMNHGEEPLIISLKRKNLFAVALECSSKKECLKKKKLYKGFISINYKRDKSKVFDIAQLFDKAERELQNKTVFLINGIPFYKLKADERDIRPYPHKKIGDSFIIMKLEGVL